MFLVVDRQEGFSESSKDAKQAHATDTHLSAHAESPVYSLSSLPEDGKPHHESRQSHLDDGLKLRSRNSPAIATLEGLAWTSRVELENDASPSGTR